MRISRAFTVTHGKAALLNTFLEILNHLSEDKMDHLNSILIEGTVADTLAIDGKEKGKYRSFVLASRRCRHDGEKLKIRTTRMRIVSLNAKMNEGIARYAYAGREVRVVGCVADDEAGIYVEAEHIEYRPEPKDGKKE
ncbi:MAG: hypothetical protein LBK13_02335 [Spirochaetales bacterium]|nr:hypothetical protein [Spirochaetales bacterium]